MNAERKNEIYDRLLEMKMEIEYQSNPNPSYINGQITSCHRFIQEVENFSIQISKEVSVHQRAVNNKMSEYESKKHDLMVNNMDVVNLPSIKDREAKVNTILKDDIDTIRKYQNELSDLNNLAKAVALKQRNLNRANADIKMLLRVMESQIKLSTPLAGSSAVDSLNAELAKSNLSKDDIFDEAETVKAENADELDDLLNGVVESNNNPLTEKETLITGAPISLLALAMFCAALVEISPGAKSISEKTTSFSEAN